MRIIVEYYRIWIKGKPKFAGVTMNPFRQIAQQKIIKGAIQKYNSYGNEWEKAYFDEFSGGYVVCHKDHQFDPTIGKFGIPRGDYEKNASKVLSKYGKRIVLESEISEEGIKTPDGLLNEVKFDIKGIEGSSYRIIKEAISKSSKQGAEIVVFYFHDKNMFNTNFVRESYEKYLINSKSKRVKKVYCVVGKYLYRI